MQVFGVSASLSEHEAHWRTFFKSLKERGLNGVKLVISDDHEGMGTVRRTVYGKCTLAKVESNCCSYT